jgi:hypothetical protein
MIRRVINYRVVSDLIAARISQGAGHIRGQVIAVDLFPEVAQHLSNFDTDKVAADGLEHFAIEINDCEEFHLPGLLVALIGKSPRACKRFLTLTRALVAPQRRQNHARLAPIADGTACIGDFVSGCIKQ